MPHVTVHPPADLAQWIATRVSKGRYADTQDYLLELVRRDRAAMIDDIERVRALIDEGRASGVVDRDPGEIVVELIAGIPDDGS